MRGPPRNRREARAHRAARALAPRHRAPRGRRQLLGQGEHAEWAMAPRPAHQRRRPTEAAILRRGQRRAPGRPDRRLAAGSHDVRNALSPQRVAERGHNAIAGIGDHGRGRNALARELRNLLKRDLPFPAELDGVRDDVMHRLVAGAHVARIDTRGHRFDALPLARQTQPGDIVPEGTMSISVTETGGETLNIRVKPLGAGAREVGHTWRVPAYPMNSLTFFDTVVLSGESRPRCGTIRRTA